MSDRPRELEDEFYLEAVRSPLIQVPRKPMTYWDIVTKVFLLKEHPFLKRMCEQVESEGLDLTLDIWAREHFKTTILTKADIIRAHILNPDERIAIMCYNRDYASAILKSIKRTYETSTYLHENYPDLFNIESMSKSNKGVQWNAYRLDLPREGSFNEGSLEAWGLTEGMPVGRHFTRIKYDDIETLDLVRNPDQIPKLIESFNMSINLGAEGGTHSICGTFYRHNGLLTYIRDKKDPETGEFLYKTRIVPATEDGSYFGEPVFISKSRMRILRSDKASFATQQLCNPTPQEDRKLKEEDLQIINKADIPKEVMKFMLVDPASFHAGGDSWAVLVVAVEPLIEDAGSSNIFVMDGSIAPMDEPTLIKTVVDLYIKHQDIMSIGVERVGAMTAEVHIKNALQARGIFISEDTKTLKILSPRTSGSRIGTKKESRITQALAFPLSNHKIFLTEDAPEELSKRLREEMRQFPAWKVDGLDALSYIYDMIEDFKYAIVTRRSKEDRYEKDTFKQSSGWKVA